MASRWTWQEKSNPWKGTEERGRKGKSPNVLPGVTAQAGVAPPRFFVFRGEERARAEGWDLHGQPGGGCSRSLRRGGAGVLLVLRAGAPGSWSREPHYRLGWSSVDQEGPISEQSSEPWENPSFSNYRQRARTETEASPSRNRTSAKNVEGALPS